MAKTQFDILVNVFGDNKLNKLGKDIDDIEDGLDDIEKPRKVNVDGSGLKSVASSFAGIAAGFFAFDSIKSFGQEIIDTTAKFEKFRAVLTTSFGSSTMADKAMSDIVEFASNTPYQVDELTDSFVKLRNSGFTPTMANMTSMGDLAASTGKGFDQLTEGIMDAAMGEWERMKEFGIKAKQEGDKVTVTFKGQSVTIANTADDVRKYLVSLGDLAGVTGSMASISKTTGGQISNLGDTYDQLTLAIGERLKPEMTTFLGGLGDTISAVKEWVEIPVSEKLIDQRVKVNMLATELMNANLPEEHRVELYKELNAIAPEVLKNIDAQKVDVEQLKNNLANYNKELERQIALEVNKEKLKPLMKKQSDAWSELAGLKTVFESSLGHAYFGKNEGTTAMGDLLYKRNKALYPLFQEMKMEGMEFDEILTNLIDKEAEIGGTLLTSSRYSLSHQIEQYRKLKGNYEGAKNNYAAMANMLSSMLQDAEKVGESTVDVVGQTSGLGTGLSEVIGDSTKSKIVTINIQTLKAADSLVMNNSEGLSLDEFAEKLTDILTIAVNDSTYAIQ